MNDPELTPGEFQSQTAALQVRVLALEKYYKDRLATIESQTKERVQEFLNSPAGTAKMEEITKPHVAEVARGICLAALGLPA